MQNHPPILTDPQLHRYARQVILEEMDEAGQLKLLSSKVLVVGVGGLGAVVLLYLAAAGVGILGIVDHDVVDVTNLQRQIIYSTDDLGRSKTTSAAERIVALNPDVMVREHRLRLTASSVASVLADYDLVVDGSDNFTTRYAVNEACVHLRKTLISAALMRFEGQISTFKPHTGGPCYRCLFPEAPDPSLVPRCETTGILGPVAGLMGCLQATEVLKELLNIGNGLTGWLLLHNALDHTQRKIKVQRNPDCPVCGTG